MTDKPKRKAAKGKALAINKPTTAELLESLPARQRDEGLDRLARNNERPRRPLMRCKTVDGHSTVTLGPDGSAEGTLHALRAGDAFGTSSDAFLESATRRIANIVKPIGSDVLDTNNMTAALAMVAAIEPQNELEATMAIQMVAANEAALTCFQRSRDAEFLEQAAAFANMGNKAMRSFALTAEALGKLRRKGEQVIRHVHVQAHEGSQVAIAETINTGGRG